MNRIVLVLALVLLLVACAPQGSPTPTLERPSETAPAPTVAQPTATAAAPPTAAPTVTASATPTPALATPGPAAALEFAGEPLPTDQGAFFSASGACSSCHTGWPGEGGRDASPPASWRASMMANASRDPFWQAVVRGEVLTNPGLQEVIEDTCATCHMPMARFTLAAAGTPAPVLDAGLLDTGHDLYRLALDGVSCTLCHQIRAEGLGQPESFSGGFVIDGETPAGEREIFGPYTVGRSRAQVMQAASGFLPTAGPHASKAEFCATCHTLYTPYVDTEGQVAGTFPEQMAYYEWQESTFSDAVPCQGCHMPALKGEAPLSTTGGPPRSPLSQHVFVGGNAYMLNVLATFGEDLAVTASSEQFRDKAAQAEEQLQTRTASLELEEPIIEGATLNLNLVVRTSAGHKFPTGFPSRRAWIHLTVQDAGGEVVFESGAVNPDGSIAGNDADLESGAFEPHYLSIDSPEQVQIYESVLGDSHDRATTVLLLGSHYLKDNRLLPSGFDKHSVADDIAVWGAARDDADFGGGGDTVQYAVDLGDTSGPYTITAELLYQSVGYRWIQELSAHDTPETGRMLSYSEQVPNQPVVVASVTAEAGR